MDAQNVTPMMKQYLSAKQAHPGELLFFRLGDFYEMFFEVQSRDCRTDRRPEGKGADASRGGQGHHPRHDALGRGAAGRVQYLHRAPS